MHFMCAKVDLELGLFILWSLGHGSNDLNGEILANQKIQGYGCHLGVLVVMNPILDSDYSFCWPQGHGGYDL